MKVLVTGAEGFVGSRLVPRLLADAHEVIAAVRSPGDATRVDRRARIIPLELRDPAAARSAGALGADAVVHLAAVASGGDAGRDPGAAWEVNAAGTARLAEAVASTGARFLLVSSAEVYGAGPARPRVETDPAAPCSPYGASKLGAEVAVLEIWRRTALPIMVARPFPHTGRGQDERFVVPAFAARLRAARQSRAAAIRVGNLAPIREFLHVDDVIDGYVALLAGGRPGEVYNIAGGHGISLRDLFDLLCEMVDYHPVPEVDESLLRSADIPHLVGSGEKLRAATGWVPRRPLLDTLREVVNAEAD